MYTAHCTLYSVSCTLYSVIEYFNNLNSQFYRSSIFCLYTPINYISAILNINIERYDSGICYLSNAIHFIEIFYLIYVTYFM